MRSVAMRGIALRHRIERLSESKWIGLCVVLYGTISAAFVAVFVYHMHSLDGSTVDLDGFGLLSRNLAQGKGFTLGYGPTLRRGPLYPLLGGAILKVFGNYQVGVPDSVAYRPIVFAQCIIFGLTCLTVWALTRRFFGPRVALLAVLLCPLIPQSLRYITMTEVETLIGLFTVLLAYTGLNLIERPRLSTGLWFGLTTAAITLTKPVTLIYPFLFLLAAWWYWYRVRGRDSEPRPVDYTRTRLIASCAALLFFALPLLPWTIRNWVVTDGQFVGISSNAPGEFLRGYINVQPKYYLLQQGYGGWDPEANAYEDNLLRQHGAVYYYIGSFQGGTVDVHPAIPAGVTTAQLEAQKDQIEGAEVKQLVLHQPLDFARKFLIQLATFWYIVQSRTASLLDGAIALVVLGFAVLGVLHARRRGSVTWPVVSVILYFNVFYAVILAFGRYSMPLYPTLLILSAGGVAALAPRLASWFERIGLRPVLSRPVAVADVQALDRASVESVE